MRLPKNRPPIHPGEILLEEFMNPYGVSQSEIARRIGLSRKHINEVVNCKKPVSTDTALRLSRLFGTSPELWLNGQMAWDIWHEMRGKKARELKAIEPLAVHG
jgi:addiction module HigA family antidote